MEAPIIPQDEQLRLETLHSLEILDTPSEERFDRLTRMAKRMFGVPISLVSIVGENRQWFKSCMGLEARETPRDISFCGHSILGDNVFVVLDAISDPRFADNPLVLGDPNIRFYAGCPLNLSGRKLGTLCIIDRSPRDFDQDDVAALKDLAIMAERELAAVQLATLDELTGLSNRRGFELLARYSLNMCARQKIPASLVFLDLDHFKPINDQFGHSEGDRALVAFGQQMQSVFRNSDLFARIGGDEFVILLTNASKQQANEAIGRFNRSLEHYNREEDRGYDIRFSYGIVEFDSVKAKPIEQLLIEGDSIMYDAKKAKQDAYAQNISHS